MSSANSTRGQSAPLAVISGDAGESDNIMGQLKARKATFTVELKGGKRLFTAVNKRAHTVARKAGKRSKVTLEQLRALKDSGSYQYWFYDAQGNLKRIRL